MKFGLLTDDDVRRLMHSYVLSGDWWVIPWVSKLAVTMSQEIEDRYYQGEASGAFVMMLSPAGTGMLALAMADKRWMSAEKLAILIRTLHGPKDRDAMARQLASQDVVVVVDDRDPDEAQRANECFALWMDWLKQ